MQNLKKNWLVVWNMTWRISEMQLLSAKSRSSGGASHQPAFMGSCLTISHTSLPCLPSHTSLPCLPLCPVYLLVTRLCPVFALSLCFMAPYDWTSDGSIDIFLDVEFGFTSMGSWRYSREWVWNIRTKLSYIPSEKWNVSRESIQGFDIRYVMF